MIRKQRQLNYWSLVISLSKKISLIFQLLQSAEIIYYKRSNLKIQDFPFIMALFLENRKK